MNKVILIGNLSKDVEKGTTQDGKQYCRFSVAVEKFGTDGADFFNIVVWNKLAENCAKYLKKGSKVGICGRLQNGSYEKNGQKFYTTDIVASEVEFLTANGGAKQEQQRPELTEITDDSLPF